MTVALKRLLYAKCTKKEYTDRNLSKAFPLHTMEKPQGSGGKASTRS